MAYIGNQTSNSYSSMDKQTITGNGGTGYTLTHAVANAQEIEVFVNNVRQEPGVAYTVSGTTLTMTGNVASTDDFYVVYQGKALQTTVPPDGSVTAAKLDTGAAASNLGTSINLATIKDSSGTNTALAIDSSGRVVQSSRPLFHAEAHNTANSGVAWTTGGNSGNNFSPVPFDTEIIDRAGNFDPSTFKFTVPVNGEYLFYAWGISGAANNWIRLVLTLKRGSNYYGLAATQVDYGGGSSTDFSHAGLQVINSLQASDEVWVTLDTGQGGTESMFMGNATLTGMTSPASGMSNAWNGFGGYLI